MNNLSGKPFLALDLSPRPFDYEAGVLNHCNAMFGNLISTLYNCLLI